MRGVAVLAGFLMFWSGQALAQTCQCFPQFRQGDIEREADIVVEGVVENVVRARRETQVSIQVNRMIKGPYMMSAMVVTPADAATCGVRFDIGQRVIIAAKRDGEFFRTNTCMNLGFSVPPVVPSR